MAIENEPMRHAFVVRLERTRPFFGQPFPGQDPNAPHFLVRHREEQDDPNDLNALVHTFGCGDVRLKVGLGDRVDAAHQFQSLEAAIAAASSPYLLREWVEWRGCRVAIVAVRVRWKSNAVIESYGDVGPEVWPDGDLNAALAQLAKAGPKPDPLAEQRQAVEGLMSGLRSSLLDIVDSYDQEVIAHQNAKDCLDKLDALAKLIG